MNCALIVPTLTLAVLLGATMVAKAQAPHAVGATPAPGEVAAADATTNAARQDRLLIVNGSTGRVVYDDGRDDLFCVTRRVFIGHNFWGQPVYRRSMRCR